MTCLVFLPDVPGSAVPRGDVVDPALAVGVQSDELLEPENERVGPQTALEDGGVLGAGDLAEVVSLWQEGLSHGNICREQSQHNRESLLVLKYFSFFYFYF